MALKLKGSTSGFVAIDAPSVAGNNTLILPENTGSAHQILANDITAGVTTFTQITVSRNGDLTVPGTISIGGTLTYEDVTSVDSVGIVTARSGVRINGGGLTIIGDTTGLKATGISTFVDVSARNITGVAATFSGDVIASSTLFADSDLFVVDQIRHTGDTNTAIRFPAADTITAETGGSERLRITSAGSIGINTTSPNRRFTLYQDATTRMNLKSLANSTVGIEFGDPDDENIGYIVYDNSSDYLALGINAGERLRIDSTGKVGINRTPTQHPLEIQHASEPTVSFWRGSTKGAALQSQSGGTYLYSYENAPLLFSVNSSSGFTERLRIDTSGNMGLGITPSAHSTTSSLVKSLQIGTVTNLYNESSDDYTILGNNIYYNGTNNKRIKAQESSRLLQHAAILQFDQVGADSADSNITFTTPFKIISDGRVQCGSQVVSGGMDMGFGVQQFSSKSDTYSAGIFGSTASGLITSIIYNSHASFNTNLCDWRSVRSNNSAFNFLRCSSNSASDNEFFIGGDGVVYSDGGTTMQSPADYAEMFEWSDGNSSDEDRRGYTVVLDGNKVRIATSSDSTDNIIGVVSGNPAVLADNAWDRWAEKYQKDDYNCYVRNSDGDRILNSSYDDTQTYVPREDRKEWDAIGMVGKLRVRKGQQTGTRWLKMRDVSDSIEEWLVR